MDGDTGGQGSDSYIEVAARLGAVGYTYKLRFLGEAFYPERDPRLIAAAVKLGN